MVPDILSSDGNGATSTAARQYCSMRAKKISAKKNVYSVGTLFTGTLSHTRKKGADVVSGLKELHVG